MFRKTFFITLILALLSLLCLSGCGLPSAESQLPAEESNAEIPVAKVEQKKWPLPMDISPPAIEGLQAMEENADLIVLGRYEAYKQTVNTISGSEEEYHNHRVYSFHIQRVLKRDAEEIIFEMEGEKISVAIPHERALLSGEEKLVFPAPYFIEPELDEDYILFLSYNSKRNRYSPAAEPFMIGIDEEGSAHLQSNLLLPEEEKSALAIATVYAENGESSTISTNALEEELSDQISGRHLDDILKEFGVEAK